MKRKIVPHYPLGYKACWILCKACHHEQYGKCKDGELITVECNQCKEVGKLKLLEVLKGM